MTPFLDWFSDIIRYILAAGIFAFIALCLYAIAHDVKDAWDAWKERRNG